MPITGFSTVALGTASVNITEELAIVLSDVNISFGNGTVSQGALFAILESTGAAAVNGTWAAVNDPFILENDGNVLANVTIKASLSAAAWFGGNAGYALMYYNYSNYEASACLLNGQGNLAFVTIPVDPSTSVTCQKLNFTDSSDQIRLDLKIQIPSDAAPGLKENSITFTSTQSV